MWGNYTRVYNNPLPWKGRTKANWMLATTIRLHTLTVTLLIVGTAITGQGLNPPAAYGAKICLLLQHCEAVSWCLMGIIHTGSVQGWGGSVIHIVESLVVSALIMKWRCHPAMRPWCRQKQTWRTCCWTDTVKRRSERLREWGLTFCHSKKQSWKGELSSGKFGKNVSRCDKKGILWAYAVKVTSATTTATNIVQLRAKNWLSDGAEWHTHIRMRFFITFIAFTCSWLWC